MHESSASREWWVLLAKSLQGLSWPQVYIQAHCSGHYPLAAGTALVWWEAARARVWMPWGHALAIPAFSLLSHLLLTSRWGKGYKISLL